MLDLKTLELIFSVFYERALRIIVKNRPVAIFFATQACLLWQPQTLRFRGRIKTFSDDIRLHPLTCVVLYNTGSCFFSGVTLNTRPVF